MKKYSFRYRITMISCCLLTAAFVLSCSKGDNNDPDDNMQPDLEAERQALAVQAADHHILPAYQQLTDVSTDLKESVSNFVLDPNVEQINEMRITLKETWLAWQQAAIYQMGPTENNTLRVLVNLYPTDVDKIEENISTGNYSLGSIANQGAEGLPAIDYLINKDSAEVVLANLQDNEQRIAYLEDLVHSLEESITNVNDEWQNGSFLQSFKGDQSTGTDVGSATGLLVNAMDQHFQRYLRDGKVAIPAGIRSAGVPRPTTVESFYGAYSRDLLQLALDSYQQLMRGEGIDGVNGSSLYSYLEAIDQDDLVEAFESAFRMANQQIELLPNDFAQQIASDEQPLIDVFVALQEIVTLIKSDMASVIGITITNQDNDGD